MYLLSLILLLQYPIVAHKFADVGDFIARYKETSCAMVFYKVFPLPDTTHPFEGIKGYAGFTDNSLLFIVEVDSFEPMSASKGIDNGSIFSGDYVTLIVSPYRSRDFAYVFVGSPTGGMYDFMRTDGGFSIREWDGLWYFKSFKKGHKWLSLFIIPFKTMFFNDSVFYIESNVSFYLKNITVSTNYNQPISSLTNMNKVIVDTKLTYRRDFKVNAFPYFRVERNKFYTDTNAITGSYVGGNIELKVGENIMFEMAANPDFSTIDADVISLDLSLEPRYYPEKRKFFLEGGKNFSFSLPLFYSRNIDTVNLGLKANVEKKSYSLYALYTRFNTNRTFLGSGLNINTGKNLPAPYFRGLYDDSIKVFCAGINHYVGKFKTFLSVEGAVRSNNGNKGIALYINRNIYPGLSFSASYNTSDTALIPEVGREWYNNKTSYGAFVSYAWVSRKTQNFRTSVLGYYHRIKDRTNMNNIFTTKNVNLQVIMPRNIFVRCGIRKNIYGENISSTGIEIATGKYARAGSINLYAFRGIDRKDGFLSMNVKILFLQSSLSLKVDRKIMTGVEDTTIFQMWGEIPLYKSLFIKPYTRYNVEDRLLESNIKAFYFITRLSQIAFVANTDYAFKEQKFIKNNYLFRVQLFFQII